MLQLVGTSARPWLVLRELKTLEEIRAYFHVRYQVYTESGYLAPREDRLDVDPYDPYCRFVGAYDTREGEPRMIGGCRMILPGEGPSAALVRSLRELPERPSTFQVENSFGVAELLRLAETRGHTLVEFGRNVCLPEYRRLGVGMALVHAIYGVGMLTGVSWGVAMCPPNLQSFYEQLGCLVLERKGTARFPGIDTELMTMVLDLRCLLGSDRQARQCAAQLSARGYVECCGDRDCLATHEHWRPQALPRALVARSGLAPTARAADVRRWLVDNGLPPDAPQVQHLLQLTRRSAHPLGDLHLLEAAGVAF